MATVGELVLRQIAERIQRGTLGPVNGTLETAGQDALIALGIWDAEVLEWHVGADFPLFDDMTEAFGKTLRIIVLPAKGE